MRLISNCCKAVDRIDPLTEINYSELEICAQCQGHCEFIDSECPDCEGEGEVPSRNFMPSNPNRIDEPYERCRACSGSGVV